MQITKNVWENGKPHQKVTCALGRLEELKKGSIDTLIQGMAKFSEKLKVIETCKDLFGESSKEYGSVLIFSKLFS